MSDIKRAIVRFNGQDLVATYDEKTQLWTATATAPADSSWSQPDHVYKAEIHVTDAAGNEQVMNSTDETYGNQLKIRVLETTKPTSEIVTPTNNSVLGANTQAIKVRFKDAGGSGLNEITIVFKVNGTAVPLKAGETAGYTLADGEGDDAGYRVLTYTATGLSDGSNTIEAQITDNDGNASDKATTTFIISTSAPTLDLTSPTDNLLTNSNKVTVAGTASTVTDGVTVSGVTVKVGDADAKSVELGENGAFSQEFTLPAEGATTIVVTVTDSLGKTTQVARTVILDTTKPIITDVTASKTTMNAGDQFTITFKVTDSAANTLSVLTVTAAPASGGQTLTITPDVESGHMLRYKITAKDAAPVVAYDEACISSDGWTDLPSGNKVSGTEGQLVTVVEMTTQGAKARKIGTAELPAPNA